MAEDKILKRAKNLVENLDNELIDAVDNGKYKLLQLLILLGADPNLKIPQSSLIKKALNNGHMNCIELLVENGANVDFDEELWEHFDLPSDEWKTRTVEYLLMNGANANIRKKGKTLVMNKIMIIKNTWEGSVFIRKGYLNLFIEYGYQIDSVDDDGHTELIYLARSKRDTMDLEMLINKGANVNHIDNNGNTVLMNLIYQKKKHD